MSRLVEAIGKLFLIALICKYHGNIAENQGFKERFTKLADIPRYRLFHGTTPEKCYIQISQGKELTNPEKVIITCFGIEERQVNLAIDNLLKETGIQEVDIPHKELQELMIAAKQLATMGLLPEWMR